MHSHHKDPTTWDGKTTNFRPRLFFLCFASPYPMKSMREGEKNEKAIQKKTVYTHTSVIRTSKLRALRSTGLYLGEFQGKYNYSFVTFRRKFNIDVICHIDGLFPIKMYMIRSYGHPRSYGQCPVPKRPDKRGMSVRALHFCTVKRRGTVHHSCT